MIFFLFVSFTLWVIWRFYSLVAYRRRNYSGKTILVTGATSEVGRRLCFRFYGLNARIIAWDGSKSRLEELQRDVVSYYNGLDGVSVEEDSAASPSSPGGATDTTSTGSPKVPPISGFSRVSTGTKDSDAFIVQSVDLSARLSLQRLAKELVAAGTVPDVILHASHAMPNKSFLERPDDAMEKVLYTNTLAPLWIAKALLPAMLEKNSSCQIVNFVTSSGDQCTQPVDAPDYVASQWGAVGAHYALRRWVHAQHRRGWHASIPTAATSAASATTSAVTSAAASRARPSTAAVGSTTTSTTATPSASAPGGALSDIRVCLACLQDMPLSSSSIFAIPYAAERGLARDEPVRAAGSVAVASPRRAGSLSASSLSARGSVGATAAGSAGVAGTASADSHLSPSQLAGKEAKRLDAAVDRAIRAIMCGVERYSDRALSNWYPLLEVLPVPWYAKLIQWFDK